MSLLRIHGVYWINTRQQMKTHRSINIKLTSPFLYLRVSTKTADQNLSIYYGLLCIKKNIHTHTHTHTRIFLCWRNNVKKNSNNDDVFEQSSANALRGGQCEEMQLPFLERRANLKVNIIYIYGKGVWMWVYRIKSSDIGYCNYN